MRHRLQKIISSAGISSRRKAETLIKQGRVKVNGKKALIGDKANPDSDEIILDGEIINFEVDQKVILLNKPSGVVTTCKDPQGRKTVMSFIPRTDRNKGLHPIGRLDQYSRGALLLSNIGELTLQLTHPKYCHAKTYLVWVEGIPSESTLEEWRKGVMLDKKKTMPTELGIIDNQTSKTLLKIILKEGMNRQIRRTAEKLGHPVIDLQRIAIANIELGNLQEGEWRELEPKEWKNLLID